MTLRSFSTAALFSACVLLAGCDDAKKEDVGATQASQQSQLEVTKYNYYVDTINSQDSDFDQALQRYNANVLPQLKSNKPLDDYSVVPADQVERTIGRLNTALAVKTEIKEIDGPAHDYLEALKSFQPITADLDSYRSTKSYTTDNGKKAREKSDEYVAALEKVIATNAAFSDGMMAKDQAMIKATFEKSAADSVDHYRSGTIYYSRQAMNAIGNLFTNPADQAARDSFNSSTEEMVKLSSAWDKKIHDKADANGHCTSPISSINSFIGDMRTTAALPADELKGGRKVHKVPDLTTTPPGSKDILITDYGKEIQDSFAHVVRDLNYNDLCGQ